MRFYLLVSIVGLFVAVQLLVLFSTVNEQVVDGSITHMIEVNDNSEKNITNASTGELPLPQWIVDYMAWHTEMRKQFPGRSLFEHPNAPKILVRICLGLCGGLHDRLGQLPYDLYLANRTGRVLLINWSRPRALENFLVPSGPIDWSIDESIEGWGFDNMVPIRALPKLFQEEGIKEQAPDMNCNKTKYDMAERAIRSANDKDDLLYDRVLTFSFLGHLCEHSLEYRLRERGETDMIHSTATFGNIFRAFFRPSKPVQEYIDKSVTRLGLMETSTESYSALHCRVRHPKARPAGGVVVGKNLKYPADKTGLPFEGANRAFAIATATRALQCFGSLPKQGQMIEPLYFLSDSNDLVTYISRNLKNQSFIEENASFFHDSSVDEKALEAVRSVDIRAREAIEENAHIDRQKGRQPSEYYSTFVDLYIAMGARCVIYGIGYYASFAAKISNTECVMSYTREEWGGIYKEDDGHGKNLGWKKVAAEEKCIF